MLVTKDQVKAFLVERFQEKLTASGIDLGDVPADLDLYRDGIIDSFGMLEMILALQTNFGATLDYVNMPAEDLTNIEKLSMHVARSVSS
jgi:acyl carrier protein